MSSIIGKEVDVELTEHLARELGVEYLKARAAGRKHTFDQFADNFGELEVLIGPDAAKEVVSKGEFLDYANGTLTMYLAQVRIAAGKLGETAKSLPAVFYCVEALNAVLNPPTIRANVQLPKDRWKYNILRKNSVSKSYLDQLITQGEISACDTDRWSVSETSGPRGWMIIWCVKEELNELFANCGLPRPNITVQHGKIGRLKLDDQTRQYLRQIRDAAYSPSQA